MSTTSTPLSLPLWRTAIPLASLTAVGMLATDLYLPAVPSLPQVLGGTVAEAQWTLASFLASLALSQLLWGWASDKFGEYSVIQWGMALLIGASALCALAPNISVLIFGRALQGLGAGSSTTAVPSLLRKRFSDAEAVKSISIVGMAESVIPALGPVLGAVLISFSNWQTTFWVIVGLTALLIPFVSKVIGKERTSPSSAAAAASPSSPPAPLVSSNLTALFSNTEYIRLSFSYAILFGCLLMFVGSGPQIVVHIFKQNVTAFSILQLFGVGGFMVGASNGGRLLDRYGMTRVLTLGSVLQILACTIFLLIAFVSHSFAFLILGWVLFCLGLGLRAPSTMAKTLATVSRESVGQASGFLMFLSFGMASVATAFIAPFLSQGFLPLALMMFLMIGLSILLARPQK